VLTVESSSPSGCQAVRGYQILSESLLLACTTVTTVVSLRTESGVRRLPKVTHLIPLYTVRSYTPTSTKFDSSLRKKINMEGAGQDMAVSHSPPQERANPSSISVLSPSTDSKDKGPVPMSFPSILRNSGLTRASRYAHLVDPVQPKKVWRRNDNEGKRWVRRRENGAFHSTVHPTVRL
jgi:hypothetical protein